MTGKQNTTTATATATATATTTTTGTRNGSNNGSGNNDEVTGLLEPLLSTTVSSTNSNNKMSASTIVVANGASTTTDRCEDDVETGGNATSAIPIIPSPTAPTEPDQAFPRILRGSYRPTMLILSLLDFWGMYVMSWVFYGTKSMWVYHYMMLSNWTKDDHPPYTLEHSLIDFMWLGILRTMWLMALSCRFESRKATKIIGYSCLLSWLFLFTKFCCIVGDRDDTTHTHDDEYNSHSSDSHSHEKTRTKILVLVGFSLACNFAECICTFMVGIKSSKDCSKAAEEEALARINEAAEGGLAFDNQSIGLWGLMLVLKPYFLPDGFWNRFCVFLTWFFLILSKGANILAPLCIAAATDALSEKDTAKTSKYVILYTVFLFANKALKEAQALSYIRVKLIAGVQLKEQVFSHLLSLSIDWHQRKSMGAVLTAMTRGINASNMVVQYLFLYLLPTLIEAVVVAFVFVQAFGAPLLSAIAINGCVIYISITIELTNYRMQFRKKMNTADNEANRKVTDALLNIETVKYFTAETHEVNRYRTSVDTFKDQAMLIQGTLSFLNASQQIVLNITLVAALLVAAQTYSKGEFTIGQFVAVNVYVMQLFAPLNFMGSIYSMALGSYVDLQNLCNMLAEKPEIEDRPDAKALLTTTMTTTMVGGTQQHQQLSSSPLQIEFRNVVFSYPSRKEVQVLKGISFIVPAGSTTAIVGATGSGKSTLSRLLFRFYEADRGQVLLGGKDVLGLTQRSLRESIGVVPQDHALFNDTLDYNIRYGARRCDAENDHDNDDFAATVEGAIRAAELNEFIADLPKGLATVVGERGQQLSGGQKQRIAIARVLMKDCPVVVLDEATSSLDSHTEHQIQASLECLQQDKTMLIIAHRLSTIQHADQIIVLSGGEILECGSHEVLLKKGNWNKQCYAALWEKQKKVE